MTQAEYIKGYKNAHRLSGRITAATKKELLKSFKEAVDLAAAEVLKAEAGELSDLTSKSWKAIEKQLRAGADIISKAAEEEIPKSITKAYSNYLAVDTKYITDAAAGIDLITKSGIENIGVGINASLLEIQASRIYSTGYTFSETIWNLFDEETGLPIGINGDYQYRIKNLILTGQAQGRSTVQIAEDIQIYVAKGKKAVFKPGRYGELIPGTGRYARRISRTIDWRALRLIRSEMNASLQESGVAEGVLNPAATGFYDWVKTAGNPIDLDGSKTANGKRCIDLDRESPYLEEDIPVYNHPNCSCNVRPRLMNQGEFVNDLKEWTPGAGPEYLDSWYNDVYLAA